MLSGNNVYINGGTVTVTGDGYGISASNDVTITGGTVTVTGDKYGIYANYVNITGGTVNATATATTGNYSQGIRGSFNMSGGTVTATGQQYGINSPGQLFFGGGQLTANVADESTWANSYGIYTNNYSIYYSHASDFIKASSYYARNVHFYKTNDSEGYILINDATPAVELSGYHYSAQYSAQDDFNDILAAMNGHKLTPKLCTVTLPNGVKPVGHGLTMDEQRVGRHQAWLVPFDYTLTTADTDAFTFYKINMIANSPSPSQEATDQVWVFLKKLNAGAVLHANMPYVYKPKAEVTDYAFTTPNATLKAKDTDIILDTRTAEDIYSFYATYDETTTATPADPFYYVGIDGNLSVGTAVSVGPLRWIIRKTSKFGSTTSYAREMHFFDGEATGINEELRMKNEEFAAAQNEEFAAAQNEEFAAAQWYTIDGRKLDGKPTTKGVYVVNGRKVVIK